MDSLGVLIHFTEIFNTIESVVKTINVLVKC